MELFIDYKESVVETNIFGKPIRYRENSFIYRKVFGIFKLYLKIVSPFYYDDKYERTVMWVFSKSNATDFGGKGMAEDLLRKINSNPDKFIRRLF